MAEDSKTQVREHFVIVQLTLLSIVVALILENLLSSLWANNPINVTSLEGWVALFEVLLVFLSALATYAGFSLSLSFSHKRPQVIDFLMPFGLLFSMQIAIGFIVPGAIHYFLLAMGCASLIAGAQLASDWRLAKVDDNPAAAPGAPAVLQAANGLWGCLGALLVAVDLVGLAGALAFIAIAATVQLAGVAGTLHGWIAATR